MRLSCFLLSIQTISVMSSKHLSASWMSSTQIELRFPNNTTRTISLKPVKNSFPGVTVDCLFTGKLDDDISSLVTVSGCKDGSDTTLSIASALLPYGLLNLQIVNGSTSIPTDDRHLSEQSLQFRYNDVLKLPNGELMHESSKQFSGKIPRAVKILTTIWYDQSLLRKHGGSHSRTKQSLAKILEFAKPLLVHSSLEIGVILKVKDVRESKLTLKATSRHLRMTLPYNKRNLNAVNSYFCYDESSAGANGLAWLGSACNKYGYGAHINEFYVSDFETAKIFVHELGHNIGMDHDFADVHGGQSSPCNGKGLMSYVGRPNKWSDCSNKDFRNWYKREGHTCLKSTKIGSGGAKVHCGGHSARSCYRCIYKGLQKVGRSWCNGDCVWKSGNCVSKYLFYV